MYKSTYILGGHYYCHPEWSWQARNMPDYDLWLAIGGTGTISIDNMVFPISSGDCFVFYPGCSADGVHDPEHPLEVIAIHFLPEPADRKLSFPLHRKIKSPRLLTDLMENAIKHGGYENADKADFWMTAALTYLDELDRELKQSAPEGAYDDLIADLLMEIDLSPEIPWSVGQMAKRCHLSNDHFTKVFKVYAGTTPLDYLLRARIARAKNDLLNSSMSINQIADQLGYTSVYFFSRQFKSKVGVSPREFRRSFAK